MLRKEISKWQKFELLTIIEEAEKRWTMRYFLVKCSNCWKVFEKSMSWLWIVTSWWWCTCVQSRNSWMKPWIICKKTYLPFELKLRNIFNWIKTRCSENYKWRSSKYYFEKWIRCEWDNFEEFYKDMLPNYKDWLSIDRKNSNWNYSKNNCRWADINTQNNNRWNNIIVDWVPLAEFCRINNVDYWNTYNKYKKWYWVEDLKKWVFLKRGRKWKKILQYDLQWNFIKEWDSTTEIKLNLWFHWSAIISCCNWKYKQSRWFIWKFYS